MFDEKKQVLEIINDFKSLSSKIRDENVKIKGTLTKNEATIQPVKTILIYNNSCNNNNKSNLNNFKHIKIDISIN